MYVKIFICYCLRSGHCVLDNYRETQEHIIACLLLHEQVIMQEQSKSRITSVTFRLMHVISDPKACMP